MESFYEVSFAYSTALTSYVHNQSDDSRIDCRDPLELLIEAEEEDENYQFI